jgi:hypothetical protein
MCVDFCEATRIDLDRILSRFDPPSSAPAEALLRVLTRTTAFEKEMAKRFEADLSTAGPGAGARGAGVAASSAEDDDADKDAFDESAPLYNKKGA